MDLYMVLLLFMSVILILVEGVYGHPKSWLTTTTKRPRTKPKRRPKRSVVNWDVTYYPRLTAEYKDILKFETFGKLFQERENAKGERKDMILSLLKRDEKQEPAIKAPIEVGFQKRVMIQLKSPKQVTSGDIKFPEGYPVFERCLERPGNENTVFFNLDSVEKIPELQHREANKLTSGTYNMHDIPRNIIKSLLLDKSALQPDDERKKKELQPNVYDTFLGYQNHHDTDANANSIPQIQENRENRYQIFLLHLLNQQNHNKDQLLNFMRNENEGQTGENWDEKKDGRANEEGESADENDYDIDYILKAEEDGSDERRMAPNSLKVN